MTEYDLSLLSNEELRQLECILMKALRPPLAPQAVIAATLADLLTLARDGGLYWSGRAKDEMRLALFHMRESLKCDLSPTCGTAVADMAAEAFCVTVMRIAKGIESATQGVAGGLQ